MYKIVIADDESTVRERLLSLLSRVKDDFLVVGSFENGYDALEGIEKLQPDLLITDIKMPYIDGIELIKQARLEFPLLQSIIISGYDSFEFAKQAIDLRVIGYLSKPISFEELKQVIYKAKTEIEKKLNTDENIATLEKQAESNLALLQENDLASLVLMKTISENFRNKLVSDQINLDYEKQFIVVFDTDQEADSLSYEKNELLRVYLSRFIEEEFHDFIKHYDFMDGNQFVSVCCINENFEKETILDKLNTIIAKVLKVSQISVSVGVSDVMLKDEVNYRKLYRHALRCLEYRTVVGSNVVLFFEDLEKQSTVKVGKVDENEYKAISYEILYGKKDEAKAKIAKLVTTISKQEYKDSYYFILSNLLDSLFKSCVDLGKIYKDFMPHVDIVQKLYASKTTDSIQQFFSDLVDKITAINEKSRMTGVQSSFEQIKKYIESNYSNSLLSLYDVADELSYSVSYISAILKKNNTSFTKYLTDIRMDKAKALLADENNKLITIASVVGYEDPYYFSHCFKKYYGVSPIEYRNKK